VAVEGDAIMGGVRIEGRRKVLGLGDVM